MTDNIDAALELKSAQPEPPKSPEFPESSEPGESANSSYPALRTIAIIYKVIAFLVALAGVIGAFYGMALAGKQHPYGTELIFTSLIYGFIGTITCLAISEGIKLFINLESKASKQVELLTKLVEKNET